MRITKGYNLMNLKKTDRNKNFLVKTNEEICLTNFKNLNINKGYVINLKKRPDRLDRFKNEVSAYLPDINIDVLEAVDGTSIDLKDEFYKKNVNKWNFDNLSEKTSNDILSSLVN